MKKLIAVFATAGYLGLTNSIAHAQTAPAAPEVQQPSVANPGSGGASENDWRFGLTLYGWLTSISGNVTARGQTVDINASFIDIVQKSDSLAAFDAHFEADKGRFGFYGDFVWAKLGIPLSASAYRIFIRSLRQNCLSNRRKRLTRTKSD